MDKLRKKFTSHNDVPVDSVRLSRDEFDAIELKIEELGSKINDLEVVADVYCQIAEDLEVPGSSVVETIDDLVDRNKELEAQLRESNSKLHNDAIKAYEQLDKISKTIHYPDRWDTVAYPDVADAIQNMRLWGELEAQVKALSEGKRFFSNCPNMGAKTFNSLSEAINDAESNIKSYLDGEWNIEVEGVCVGIVTHTAQQVDRVDKPPAEELDEEGFDENGNCWISCDYECNYKMLPIDDDKVKRFRVECK